MLLPRKALSHLLLAMLALGGLNCPCPASATGEAMSHENHGSHHGSTVGTEGCSHLDCATEYASISAERLRQDAAFPCAYPVDDIDAVETEIVVRADHAAPAGRTGPPTRFSVPSDTPVRRFDRLLD